MTKYKTIHVEGLNINPLSSSQDDYIKTMDIVSSHIEGCIKNLGTYVDIISIEHCETYCAIAENMYINFTVKNREASGNDLKADNSSTRLEDYDYSELTKFTVAEK